ncbi:MAG: glycosyltransferase family 4 protein [Planctomycetota bacterium]
MRIALLSSVTPDPAGGELARIVATAASALRARGHTVLSVAPAPASATAAPGVARDQPAQGVDLGAPGLVPALVARGAEVVHVYGWDVAYGDLVRRVASALPVIVSLVGADPSTLSGATEALGAAQRVVFPSLAHLVRVREHVALDKARVRIVSPGHGLALPARRVMPRPFAGRGPLTILHPGPFDTDAGSDDLVAATAGLPAGSVRVWAFGAVPDGRRGAAGRALSESVVVMRRGAVSEVIALASECHLAALPSRRQESYALGLDEAFALGLPAWVTCGAVASERFDRGAFQVLPAGDPGAWRAAIEGVLRAPRRLAEAFAGLPADVPTAARAAAALEVLYTDVLTESTPLGADLRQGAGDAA